MREAASIIPLIPSHTRRTDSISASSAMEPTVVERRSDGLDNDAVRIPIPSSVAALGSLAQLPSWRYFVFTIEPEYSINEEYAKKMNELQQCASTQGTMDREQWDRALAVWQAHVSDVQFRPARGASTSSLNKLSLEKDFARIIKEYLEPQLSRPSADL